MSTPALRQPALTTLLLTLLTALVVALLLPLMPLFAPAAEAGAATPVARQRSQRVDIHVLPGIRHPSNLVAPSSDASQLVEVTLTPATKGRAVRLEQRVGAGWQTLAIEVSPRSGTVQFFAPNKPSARYRAVALPWRNLPKASSSVAAAWGAPDFVDEFDGTTLGAAWQHRIQFYNPWGGRACSKGDPSAVAVSGGVLQLSSAPDPTRTDLCPAVDQKGQALGSFPYRVNGHISTQKSADFLYGVAAARMRFPRSLGQHAAFWLQPRGLLEDKPTPWGAEIDVVEWYGARAQKEVMASVVHEPQPDGSKRQIGGMIRNPDRFLATRSDSWWNTYHVFSVEWTPTEYIFRIAGHEVWRTSEGVSHVPEFLILSMLSSDFELPSIGDDTSARTAEVDWVAFWEAS